MPSTMELWKSLLLSNWKVEVHVEVVSSNHQLQPVAAVLAVCCAVYGLGDRTEPAVFCVVSLCVCVRSPSACVVCGRLVLLYLSI